MASYAVSINGSIAATFDTAGDARAFARELKSEDKERVRQRDTRPQRITVKKLRGQNNPVRKLKFGSPAYRAKYLKKNKPKRKAAQRKKTAAHRSGTRAKKTRMREMLKSNPGDYFYAYKADATAKAAQFRREGYKVVVRKGRADRKGEWIVFTTGRNARPNPPRTWTRISEYRVVRKNGEDVLEVRK